MESLEEMLLFEVPEVLLLLLMMMFVVETEAAVELFDEVCWC